MSVAQSIPSHKASVVSKALFRAAEALGLSSVELAGIVGTSQSTLSRIRNHKRGPIPLGSKEGELALLFLRVFRSLDALVGGYESHARAWLHAENRHVGGVPLERMMKIEGPQMEGVPPHWLGYITVDSVDTSTSKAESLGATVYVPPTDIPNIGRFSVIADPTGGTLGLFQSAR